MSSNKKWFIMGSCIGIFLVILMFVVNLIGAGSGEFFGFILIFLTYPVMFLLAPITGGWVSNGIGFTIIILVSSIVEGGLLGMFIGWIIGNKKQPDPYYIKPKIPNSIIIISWLIFLYGILRLFFNDVIPLYHHSPYVIYIVTSIILLLAALGIRRINRSALYVFATITLIELATILVHISSYIYEHEKITTISLRDSIIFADIGIRVVILLYLWKVFKRFK